MEQEYYKPFVLTEQGMYLRQQAIAGKYTVDFTRAVIGQGHPASEDDMFTLTRVVAPAADMPVKESYAEKYNHIIVAVVDNLKLTGNVMMTEVGIMARLLDKSGRETKPELLYGYTYTTRYDYLPDPASGYIVQREMMFDTVISRTENVKVTFDASRVYVTVRDLNDHMYDLNAHTPYPLGVTFTHGLGMYPTVTVFETVQGAGMGGCGETPSGGDTEVTELKSQVTYLDGNRAKIALSKKYAGMPKVTKLSGAAFSVVFADVALRVEFAADYAAMTAKFNTFNIDLNTRVSALSSRVDGNKQAADKNITSMALDIAALLKADTGITGSIAVLMSKVDSNQSAIQKALDGLGELTVLYPLNAVLTHGLDDYPAITVIETNDGAGIGSCGETPCGGNSEVTALRSQVTYLDSNRVKLSLGKKFDGTPKVSRISDSIFMLVYPDTALRVGFQHAY